MGGGNATLTITTTLKAENTGRRRRVVRFKPPISEIHEEKQETDKLHLKSKGSELKMIPWF